MEKIRSSHRFSQQVSIIVASKFTSGELKFQQRHARELISTYIADKEKEILTQTPSVHIRLVMYFFFLSLNSIEQ